MTDILCQWLNNEVKISKRIEQTSFARDFSNGFLIGEVLSKYQLQDDFDQFSQNRTSDSQLNNFTRLEPVLHLLEVPFDTNVARDIMTEKHGVATRIMYQLFIALNKKQKANLTGVAMETMRPAAPVKLEGVESQIYKENKSQLMLVLKENMDVSDAERLKHMTPRQTDLNLDALMSRFQEKQIQMERTAFKERFEEQERHQQVLLKQREELIAKYKDSVTKKSEVLAKIQAATVHIPKPPANKTAKAIQARRDHRRMVEAEIAEQDIAAFEERLRRTLPPSQPLGEDETRQAIDDVMALPDELDLIKPASNDEYIGKISKRLNEDAAARLEREKRRRKVLVDQLKAHDAQEEAHREEMLVNRLMRQSQQERRIAVQLLQARKEKETIKKNRLMREKQYEERRLAEFEEALNREAEMARLAKLDYIEQTQKDRELHDAIMAQRQEERYNKHYDMAQEVLLDVVDYTTKIGEYRDLTNQLMPPKLMREWTALFVAGQPLYEVDADGTGDGKEPTPEQILEEERQMLLDEGDFNEYRQMVGEWSPPEESEIGGPPRNNPIVGHIVQRVFNIVHPPSPPPPPPEFPAFPIKACVIGKVFSGKTSVASRLAETHRLQRLCVDDLVQEALEAHREGELAPEPPADPPSEPPPDTAASVPPSADTEIAKNSERGSAVSSVQQDNRQAEDAAEKQDAEGQEKGDPEKPIREDTDMSNLTDSGVTSSGAGEPMVKTLHPKTAATKSTVASSRKSLVTKPQLSPRAKLGAKAAKVLKRGKPLDDPILIEILVEAIKRIPEGTGWVMDGFPTTYNQAKALEKALSGFDASSKENVKAPKEKGGKMRKSQLAPDPKPAAPPAEPGSGINVVLLFDLPNELCLKRSAGRYYTSQSGQDYHQEFHPPPEGSATGVGKEEKVLPVTDPAHDQEQIQHRITAFQDTWAKMEKWFVKFGSLKKVDAAQELETVYLEAEHILEETLKKLQGPPEPDVLEIETKEEVKEEKPPEPEKVPEPPVEEKVEESRSRPGSKKGSRSGSAKRSGSRGSKDKADKKPGKSPSRSASKADSGGKKSAKSSRGSSPKSPKRGKSGKKGKTPEPEPEPEPEAPPGTPPPQPGSDEWEYVDQPIEEELAQILAPYWDAVENTYIGNSKTVFRRIRDERETIVRYFYQIRKDFLSYLRRPDHKQEFVSQFQKEFNEVPDDIREDEETRCELHQRTDDLRERLWSICDERKEAAETERATITTDGWLDDHTGLLTNHYITEMQAEVDRFQDTVRMLKDYYRGMEGKIPDQLPNDYARIPLIELPETEKPEVPGAEDGEEGEGEDKPGTPGDDVRSVPSKSNTPSAGAKKKKESTDDMQGEQEEPAKPRIPLVPRRPVSPDPNAAGKGKTADKAKAKPAGKEAAEDTPQPPEDPDEKLLFDAHTNGYSAIDRIIANEQAAKEAEEAAEREREAAREIEKQKAAAATKGKGGKDKKGKKSRSPSPKKGKGKETPPQPTPPPPAEEESEEEREKKQLRERARQEFFAAIQEEAAGSKVRLDLIRKVSVLVLQDLRNKADDAYKDMNDWLGARFLKEMESIDTMSEILRDAIERFSKLKEEVILQDQDFIINEGVMCLSEEDVKVLRTPSPKPRPPPVEVVTSDTFSVEQLHQIHQQFALTAPTGYLSMKSFQDVMFDLAALSQGTELMPDFWLNLNPEKLELMGVALSADGEYIDWRSFLLAAAQPWPAPTQTELLETLARFQEMDQKQTGLLTREQYERVDLWFHGLSHPPTPTDPMAPLPFDRLGVLKDAFFDMFADTTQDPPTLDYISLLLYMSTSPDPYEGFLRALSVTAGTHMPRLAKRLTIKKPSRPSSQASLALSVELEAEKDTSSDPLAPVPDDIPDDAATTAMVPLDSLVRSLSHGQSMKGDSHRFSTSTDPEDAFSKERLAGVYQELGADNLEPLPFTVIMEHPVIQDIISMCNSYRATDLKAILSNPPTEAMDTQSLKTE